MLRVSFLVPNKIRISKDFNVPQRFYVFLRLLAEEKHKSEKRKSYRELGLLLCT